MSVSKKNSVESNEMTANSRTTKESNQNCRATRKIKNIFSNTKRDEIQVMREKSNCPREKRHIFIVISNSFCVYAKCSTCFASQLLISTWFEIAASQEETVKRSSTNPVLVLRSSTIKGRTYRYVIHFLLMS